MIVEQFGVEDWMDRYEEGARYNITDTCAKPLTLNELFALSGEDKQDFMETFFQREQTYGPIWGDRGLKEEISHLYEHISPDEILTEHGATGGNQHIFFSLIRPGDRVIAYAPSYQQFYSAPRSLGAQVTVLHLKKERGYMPDLDELRQAAREGVRMICLNNPNNPTGSLIPKDMMEKIVDIAREAGAYLFCDEVYAGVPKGKKTAALQWRTSMRKALPQAPCPRPSPWQDSVWAGWPQRMRKHWPSSGG